MFTRRGGVLAGVVALHLVALVAAVNARMRPDEVPELASIHIALLDEPEAPREAPPEVLLPKLEPPPPVDIVMPQVLIPAIDMPEPRAIVAAPPPPPPPAPTPVVARSEEPDMLHEDEVDYLRMPEPRYPQAAKQARLQGTVLVWVLIDPEGRPKEVRVHQSSGHDQLDREGCAVVSRALFKPYRKNGLARSAQAIVPIQFTLTARTARRH